MTATFPDGLIRPWYRSMSGDHIHADCPVLARETDAPVEGSGWLNPARADRLCPACFSWDAECQCGASLSYEEEPGLHDLKCAEKWMSEHFCIPSIRLIPSPRPAAAVPPPTRGQAALFDMEPAR